MNDYVRIGNNVFQIVTKQQNGRTRQYLRCTFISQKGASKGQRCSYEKRRDSASFKRSQGIHQHMFDIKCFFTKAKHQTMAQIELRNNFFHFLSSSNISFRQATSSCTIQLLNSFIQYGFSLGRSKSDSLDQNDLWGYNDRHSLRNDFIDYSNGYCTTKLQEFKRGKVRISIDSSTINHIQTVDIVLLCHKPDKQVESLLYKELIINPTALEYRNSIVNILQSLDNIGINVISIISDGFKSQIAAFDPDQPTSFHKLNISSKLKKVLFVYCRCHLLNLAINDLIKKSHGVKRCQVILIELSKKLRKTYYRKRIGAMCPEHVQTRFCYDFRIIKFIIRNLAKIQTLLDAEVDTSIFAYGVIMEKMWEIVGIFEERSATLANTYEKFLNFMNDLMRIEKKAHDINNSFLEMNCRLLRNIVYY